jgi:hypothetical protein
MSAAHDLCRPGDQRDSPQDAERLAGDGAVHFLDAQRGFLHRGFAAWL